MAWVQGDGSAQDFIYRAFRKIGQVRPGYTPQQELLQDALTEWTDFFDALGAERDAQYSNPVYQHSVSGPGSQTNGNGYQVGPTAADWVQPRPESIIRANVVFTSVGPQPVYIHITPVSQEEWASLAIQQIPAVNITSIFWYDPQWPNGVFNVFPPLNGNAIQLYQRGILVPPATLATPYTAPPGYADGVTYGLAERLYYLATKEVVVRPRPYPNIAGAAALAWQNIRRINRPIPRAPNDFACGNKPGGFYDSFVTYTGEPY